MKITLNSDKLKKWRVERCWSQEQLAEVAGVSLRTIQRIENGKTASRDSALSLATAFNVDVSTLSLDIDSQVENARAAEKTKQYLQFKLSAIIHVASYVFVIAVLVAIDLSSSPERLWVIWPAIGWGIGVLAHIGSVYLLKHISKTEEQISYLD